MPFEVMNTDGWNSERIGEPMCRARAHEEGARKSWPFGIGDGAQVGRRELRLNQYLSGKRDEAADMVPGGELGHDAAVVGVHGDLGIQGMRKQPVYRVVKGDAGFVARSFDPKNDHGMQKSEEGFEAGREWIMIRPFFKQPARSAPPC